MSLTKKLGSIVLVGLAGLLSGCNKGEGDSHNIKDLPKAESPASRISPIPIEPDAESRPSAQDLIVLRFQYDGKDKEIVLPDYASESFKKSGLTSNTANQYNPRFHRYGYFGLVDLHRAGITPEIANSYDRRFDVDAIIKLRQRNIEPRSANAFDERFASYDVFVLIGAGITSEEANRYRFDNAHGIVDLRDNKITSDTANSYDPRFTSSNIIDLIKNEVPSEVANSYRGKFRAWAISVLFKAGIKPEQANPYLVINEKYDTKIDPEDITRFINEGISPETIERLAREEDLKKAITEWIPR
ncbi:MAG: hypothetical protein AABY07_09535 [Nanoarchaeota archaeon]